MLSLMDFRVYLCRDKVVSSKETLHGLLGSGSRILVHAWEWNQVQMPRDAVAQPKQSIRVNWAFVASNCALIHA
jgi:hypothetical protein